MGTLALIRDNFRGNYWTKLEEIGMNLGYVPVILMYYFSHGRNWGVQAEMKLKWKTLERQ